MRLFWRIYGAVFVCFAVVLAAVLYAGIEKQVDDARRQTIAQKRTLAAFLAAELQRESAEQRWPFESLRDLTDDPYVRFWWVVRDDGMVHLAGTVEEMRTRAAAKYPDLTSLPKDRPMVHLAPDRSAGVVIHPFDAPGGTWSFWLGFSLAEVKAARRSSLVRGAALAPLALVVIGAVLYVVVRHFVRPAASLAEGARHLGRGDLGHRVPVESSDELGDLARTFNRMAADLQARQQALLEAKGKLEQRVSERTAELQEANDRLRCEVTERRRAEEALAEKARELARSNAELQEFAYVASHDLQEPLRMVSSYVQLLDQRYGDALDDDAREFIGYAVDGARRMQALISDLLQYSRVGTRGKPFAPTDCDGLMDDVLANLEVAIREAGARVTHDALPQVAADEGQLARVFQNLIGNALKFCDGTPEIHVSAERGDGRWRFSVRDNGIGIDPEQQESIFTVFHRLHGRDEYAGTGMGLAITKKIVERHGGRIWVESEPGEGSTFWFTIPDREGDAHGHEHDDGGEADRAVACPAGGDSAG